MATPHNQAENGQFADVVLMPGDPLRAKVIAEKYLEDCKLVNEVRGMLGFTGTYKGRGVSVMASGMGMPSIGIYSYELYTQYDVKTIIRIGSAGAYVPDLRAGDVVLAKHAWSESSFAKTQNGTTEDVMLPSAELNKTILAAGEKCGVEIAPVGVHSSDVFYRNAKMKYYEDIVREKDCSVVEMESFALFHNANVTGKQAACLLTISDSFVHPDNMSAEERQNSFTQMMEVALESCLLL